MAGTLHRSPLVDILGDAPAADPARRTARAYCGPAHGRSWTVDTEVDAQSIVWLRSGRAASVPYRVTLDPTTLRPARDRLGNLVYMPVR
jgi:hypothetical protein